VTPKGTRPGQATPTAPAHDAVHTSSRYTPPTPQSVKESPRWVPVVMLVLIGLAVVVILLRYLVWTDTNVPVIAGLVLLLGGLFVATKWH
jgi:ABC-type siderophore export system fused ATPase/permease subunit